VASKVLDQRAVLFADESDPEAESKPDLPRPLGFYRTECHSEIGLTVDAISPMKAGSLIGIPSAPSVLFPDGAVLTPSIGALERLQGFSSGWTESAVTAMRAPSWRLVGSAVSAPVDAWVAGRIARPRLPHEVPQLPPAAEKSLPITAFSVSGARRRVKVGGRPAGIVRATLTEYFEADCKPFSEDALRGFVSRVDEGGLWTPPGFVDRLKAAIARAAA
jgi:DNA (cytosine-5)-methyltransferase 1